MQLGAIQLAEGFPQDAHGMVQGVVRSVTSPHSDGTGEVCGVQDLMYRRAGTHCWRSNESEGRGDVFF